MPILFQFDVRMVALFVVMAFFVQATAIWGQAFAIRELQQYRGIGAALMANLCVAVGLILRLFADRLPYFFTPILSNTLILTGSGLFYIALSQFTGFSYSKAFLIGVIAAVLSFLFYFTYWEDDIGKRAIVFSLGSMIIVFMLIYQLWRTEKTYLRFSASLMLVPFLLYGMFLIIRTVSLVVNPPQDVLSLTPVQSTSYLSAYALSFLWSLGFILMLNQHLRSGQSIPEPRKISVFLCHASQDKPMVRELYQRLITMGWINPWLDEEKLSLGQHWTSTIEEAIDSADSVIIFLSQHSVEKEGFVQRELHRAWNRSLEKPQNVIFLIPFRLDDCEVPHTLRERQWGDYFGAKKEKTYENLIHSLRRRYEQKMLLEKNEQRAKELARIHKEE